MIIQCGTEQFRVDGSRTMEKRVMSAMRMVLISMQEWDALRPASRAKIERDFEWLSRLLTKAKMDAA